MATVTITFTDTSETDGVEIKIVSDPPFDMEKNEGTSAQHLGVKMLEILNQQLDKEGHDHDHDGCCGHPANASAPPITPEIAQKLAESKMG